jgi:GNAT superfamily N-acetyltransferase
MALKMLRHVLDEGHLPCRKLVVVLMQDLQKNVENGRPDRELVLLTSRTNPGAIAGYMYLEHRRRSVYIHLLEACFQKKGIGSILLDYAIDVATDAGKSYVELVSVTDPATIAFYEAKGFLRGPAGTKKFVLPTQWNSVDYSDVDRNEKKEALPKLHLPIT